MEEFILAMHLCDMGQKGEPLPDPLPIQLVPPSLRRTWQSQQPGSGATTPGSVTSNPGVPAAQMPMGMPQGMPGLPAGVPGMQGVPVIPGMPPGMTPASFEDKRRENWEAGQAELQKRRESLMEQQKKEKEAREKKEKEEKELREKQK